jgi:hypothetical protein
VKHREPHIERHVSSAIADSTKKQIVEALQTYDTTYGYPHTTLVVSDSVLTGSDATTIAIGTQ